MSDKNTQQDRDRRQFALDYHAEGRPGKIEVISTKPCLTQRDLSLAYSPGVAAPCEEIAKNPQEVFKYTAKGNLVGVISNGSAVLGLGDIGPLAGKPVMEGKGILFKRFADIDVFDIEIDAKTVDEMVTTIKALGPTFGGINLEDIKAPECFEVEKQLQELLDIPVFHDDQHGTAIITAAGMLNALEVAGKKIEKVKVVFSGAGAASIACAELLFDLGLKRENLLMCDSKGVIYKGRTEGMNEYKDRFAVETEARDLKDAMKGADAFMGLSRKGLVTKEMVKSMNKDPIIFAMANPEPEIYPDDVADVRSDAIMATGRSDFPNQVNNVLGFPFIFRGALDVRAKKINKEMKLAAVSALANLAKEEVAEEVKLAYGNKDFKFGKEYLIPKPFDKRVLTRIAPAVAKAAMDSGVARESIDDLSAYAIELEHRLGQSASFMKSLRTRLSEKVKEKGRPISVAFAAGEHSRVLNAANVLVDEGKIHPILIGNESKIQDKLKTLGLSKLKDKVTIVTPEKHEKFSAYKEKFYKENQRRGASLVFAEQQMTQSNSYGAMMAREGDADCLLAGPNQTYPECFRPITQIIGTEQGRKAAGIFIMTFKNRVLFLADCTAQISPTPQDLCNIALDTSALYKKLMDKDPRVAFLSFSNFGSSKHPEAKKVKDAVAMAKKADPKLRVDGEIQADVAVNKDLLANLFDFTDLDDAADILIFPDLNSANISYKLLSQLSDVTPIGPILVPMQKVANIIQRTTTVNEIVNMAVLNAILS